jgi:GTP-binding protein Era
VRSGFVALVGRPNAGKSTLVNRLCGAHVSIVSDKPQTTRHQVRGVLNHPEGQVVFVDTPGLHKPVTALGERLNATASEALDGVDVVWFVVDATKPFGRGDAWVADRVPAGATVIVTKIDKATPQQVLTQLTAAQAALPTAAAFFPVSGRTGEGLDALVAATVAQMEEGPQYYPDGMVSDRDEGQRIAELVREQLLALTGEELPYSIATRVTDMSEGHVRCEIVVERESQKGMVIGKGGLLLKQVGIAVRRQVPEIVFLDLRVKVDPHWQRRPDRVERLGY